MFFFLSFFVSAFAHLSLEFADGLKVASAVLHSSLGGIKRQRDVGGEKDPFESPDRARRKAHCHVMISVVTGPVVFMTLSRRRRSNDNFSHNFEPSGRALADVWQKEFRRQGVCQTTTRRLKHGDKFI